LGVTLAKIFLCPPPPPPPFELVQCCHDERRLATLVFELDFAKSF
jgi:hypothetical protein